MALFGLFDLAIAVPLVSVFFYSVASFLRPGGDRAVRKVPFAVSLAGIGLFVVFNVAYFNGFGTDPVIGEPTPAQVTGTWVGSGGATLVVRPDGTFVASRLPRDVGNPGIPAGPDPLSGSGTWVIGPGNASSGGANPTPDTVIFALKCSPEARNCANGYVSFGLQAETSSPAGGPALFYYQGDPDDWSNQYAFTLHGHGSDSGHQGLSRRLTVPPGSSA